MTPIFIITPPPPLWMLLFIFSFPAMLLVFLSWVQKNSSDPVRSWQGPSSCLNGDKFIVTLLCDVRMFHIYIYFKHVCHYSMKQGEQHVQLKWPHLFKPSKMMIFCISAPAGSWRHDTKWFKDSRILIRSWLKLIGTVKKINNVNNSWTYINSFNHARRGCLTLKQLQKASFIQTLHVFFSMKTYPHLPPIFASKEFAVCFMKFPSHRAIALATHSSWWVSRCWNSEASLTQLYKRVWKCNRPML